MQKTPNKPLLAAALCCGLAAFAHAGCILFGADWYRFFGAGEQMAQLAAQGHWYPTVVTSNYHLRLAAMGLLCAVCCWRYPAITADAVGVSVDKQYLFTSGFGLCLADAAVS